MPGRSQIARRQVLAGAAAGGLVVGGEKALARELPLRAGRCDGLSAGSVAIGSEAIRQVFSDFVASGVQLTLGDQQPALRVGDLALGSTRLVDSGVTAELARRQPDGTWRWVIDQWNVLGE